MDGEQNLESKDEKQRAWTIDEIRKNSANWTLAGDVGLFNLLNEFSHNIISRTHEVENAVDSLVHQTKMASVKINNVINDFHMLSNLQFVENRVYDEEVQETVPEEKPVVEKTKEQKEAEMLPKIVRAVELGLAVLDQAFDKINVNEISDSDDEDLSSEGRTILEPKDPYEHRPLPFIIGSTEFQNCDHAGLKELIEEEIESSVGEESSISSETDETSSDEEEPLPAEDEKFSNMRNHKFPAQSISDRLSSSEESELFGSEKEDNDFAYDSSFESKKKEGRNIQRSDIEVKVEVKVEEKETRQNSISSLQSKLNLPQVLPVKQKEKDLFAQDDEISDEESPFRKKSSLFASDVNFGGEKDDMFDGDLFGESIKKTEKVQKTESPKVSHIPNSAPPVPQAKQLDLFANDEDSEDDIFNTLMKTKKPTSKGSNAGSQDLSEKAESSSTPSSAPSTKPSGNAFDFATGDSNADSLFGDESDADDLFTKKKQAKKFDFDAFEDDDDLFGITSNKTAKKPEVKKPSKPTEKKLSLFSDSDSFDETNTQSKPFANKPISLFEDSDSFEPSSQSKQPSTKTVSLFEDNNVKQSTDDVKKPMPSKQAKKVKSSFFEDSGSDQETISAPKSVLTNVTSKVPQKSLFDDDDEEDVNIFSQISKKPTSKDTVPVEKKQEDSKKLTSVTKKPIDSIFDESLKTNVKPTSSNEVPKSGDVGLFGNVPVEKEEFSRASNKKNDTKKSLFEDSDNFDLFAPKSPKKKTEPVDKTLQLPQPDKVSLPEKTDEFESSDLKSKPSTSISAPSNIDDSGVDFDTPIDSSKTLNVIGKDRVKVAVKRRLPSRKGRLAALETAEQERKIEEPKPQSTEKNPIPPKDELFSEPPKAAPPSTGTSYKVEEKKKMDIMSQLISEVSASKVGKKSLFQNDADDEEEVDIFAEAADRSQTKKQSFSFLPPKENSIDSGFLNETKGSSEAKSNTTEIDDAENDDFFVEPSFKTFRSSVSRADSVLNMSDDDDDLFSAIKSSAIPQAKTDGNDVNDLLDDSDIFADIQKEKYELFPTQLYDNEDDDDIFGSIEPTTNDKFDNATNKNKTVKKIETQKVDAFEDPLTGLLSED
ncbi:WASH complex subunit 2-like isoform X2 [Uloborus diversus]|uniref:WASH complex subunit 2-like isoform X2 n=1 Tax=Uloborus diversus TaxID=327109 RepID=UPI002409165A|nr:WASH complex subunit 2-like isoform X2 [Uloborus diversus]